MGFKIKELFTTTFNYYEKMESPTYMRLSLILTTYYVRHTIDFNREKLNWNETLPRNFLKATLIHVSLLYYKKRFGQILKVRNF